jgi:hypothetical protein
MKDYPHLKNDHDGLDKAERAGLVSSAGGGGGEGGVHSESDEGDDDEDYDDVVGTRLRSSVGVDSVHSVGADIVGSYSDRTPVLDEDEDEKGLR